MTISKKLETIQKALCLTQSKLAEKVGVSFPSLNSWMSGKSIPRSKNSKIIEDLFLEVTGQKQIPEENLQRKKRILLYKTLGYKSVLREVLNNPDIRDQFVLKLTYHSTVSYTHLTLPTKRIV